MSDRIIHVLGQRVQLKQPSGGFQTSIDAVLLGAFCPAKQAESVLDLGCGVGAAGLCVVKRVGDIMFTGVEKEAREATLAQDNAALNSVEAEIICSDIRDYRSVALFDHTICNPPYLEAGTHLRSPDPARADAMGHAEAALEDWVRIAHRSTKPRGSFTMIHRADHIDQIIALMQPRFGGITLLPIHPRKGEPAKRILIRGHRDTRSPSTILPGLILHEDNGNYTPEADAILREAQGLY